MSWSEILQDSVFGAVCILLGMLLMFIIRRFARDNEPFIPEIPHVRVGTPVYIGDDLYVLKAYHYKERSATADSERTAIFKSVPTQLKEDQVV